MHMICKHGDQITVKRSDKDYDFGTVIGKWDNYKDALLSARVERMVIKHMKRAQWTHAGGEWTEAAFWSFLRSGLRQMSRRWPPLVRHVWLEHRRPNQSANLRLTWEFQCSECAGWFKRKGMQADHIVPCGSLRSWDDWVPFATRLFCEKKLLRILCAECHQERHGKGESVD